MSLIKDVPHLQAFDLKELLAYSAEKPTDKTFANTESAAIFLLALDKGQQLPEHAPPGDALMQVLEGEVLVTVDGGPIALCAGQTLLIPAGAKRSPQANTKAKLLVTLVKQVKS